MSSWAESVYQMVPNSQWRLWETEEEVEVEMGIRGMRGTLVVVVAAARRVSGAGCWRWAAL